MANAQTIRSEEAKSGANPSGERLKDVAGHTLQYFSDVASEAAEQLGERRPDPGTVLAAVNTLTGDRAVQNLDEVGIARARELHILTTEPAIARIVAADEDGKSRTYFIARGTPNRPPRDGSLVASYRSPLGRLAALPIGAELDVTTALRAVRVRPQAAEHRHGRRAGAATASSPSKRPGHPSAVQVRPVRRQAGEPSPRAPDGIERLDAAGASRRGRGIERGAGPAGTPARSRPAPMIPDGRQRPVRQTDCCPHLNLSRRRRRLARGALSSSAARRRH